MPRRGRGEHDACVFRDETTATSLPGSRRDRGGCGARGRGVTPIDLGPGSTPSVVVDPAGTAHILFLAGLVGTPQYCRLPRGATACDIRTALGDSDDFEQVRILRRDSDGVLIAVGRATRTSCGSRTRPTAGPASSRPGSTPPRSASPRRSTLAPDGQSVLALARRSPGQTGILLASAAFGVPDLRLHILAGRLEPRRAGAPGSRRCRTGAIMAGTYAGPAGPHVEPVRRAATRSTRAAGSSAATSRTSRPTSTSRRARAACSWSTHSTARIRQRPRAQAAALPAHVRPQAPALEPRRSGIFADRGGPYNGSAPRRTRPGGCTSLTSVDRTTDCLMYSRTGPKRRVRLRQDQRAGPAGAADRPSRSSPSRPTAAGRPSGTSPTAPPTRRTSCPPRCRRRRAVSAGRRGTPQGAGDP